MTKISANVLQNVAFVCEILAIQNRDILAICENRENEDQKRDEFTRDEMMRFAHEVSDKYYLNKFFAAKNLELAYLALALRTNLSVDELKRLHAERRQFSRFNVKLTKATKFTCTTNVKNEKVSRAHSKDDQIHYQMQYLIDDLRRVYNSMSRAEFEARSARVEVK